MLPNYKEVFRLFTDENFYDSQLNAPFQMDSIQYATDGYSLISLPVEVVDLGYENKVVPKVKQLALALENDMGVHAISVNEIEKKLVPVMIEEVITNETSEDCEDCNGEGTVEWEYDGSHRTYHMEADCPCCGGEGSIEKIQETKTGKMIVNPNVAYKMDCNYYSYAQLQRLVTACKMMEVATIVITSQVMNKSGIFTSGIFSCGHAKIIIAPYCPSNEEPVPDRTIC